MAVTEQALPVAEGQKNSAGSVGEGPTPHTSMGATTHRLRWRLMLGGALLLAILVWQLIAKKIGQGSALRFETASVQRGDIQAVVTATGNLNPVVNVQVGSQVSGNIIALYADFNTRVTKGQLVAEIDPALFQAEVDAAKATFQQQQENVGSAEALLAKARAEVGSATAAEKNAEAILAKDEATFKNLQYQWLRQQKLFQEDIVSQQDHDSADASFRAADAQVVADRSQVDATKLTTSAAEASARSAVAQRDAAIAQARQARAALNRAEINLQHTKIIAPVSGTVISRHFDVGQTVAASFQAPDIFDIGEDLTKMQVDTSVDEADVGVVLKGQQANFTVDAFPNDVFHGVIEDVRRAPITAQNVVTYDVVVTVANPDLKLFPGMTAKVTILTARVNGVLKVPNASLRYLPASDVAKQIVTTIQNDSLGSKVYVLRGKTVTVVPVTTGITDGRFTAVESQRLKEGDPVILRQTASHAKETSTNTSTSSRMSRF